MFGGLQAAKVVQAVVLQSLQAAGGQAAGLVEQGFVVKQVHGGARGQLFAHRGSCLLSVISLRSKTLARKSWFCTVAGGRPSRRGDLGDRFVFQ